MDMYMTRVLARTSATRVETVIREEVARLREAFNDPAMDRTSRQANYLWAKIGRLEKLGDELRVNMGLAAEGPQVPHGA